MSLLDLASLKNEAKTLKKKIGQRGFCMTLSQARDLIAQSAGVNNWNALYLKLSSPEKNIHTHKLSKMPFYGEIFSAAMSRSSRLIEALIKTFPALNTRDGHHILAELIQVVLGPAIGADEIMIQQETPESCVITPSMMTSSRWKGGLGFIGNGENFYTPVMLDWTLPWLQEHGGIVFIRQNELPKLLNGLQSKTDLPVRVVDLTTPPFPLGDETLTPSTLNAPGMAKLATKTSFPNELKPFLLAGQISNSMLDGRRQNLVSGLLSALAEYEKKIGPIQSITEHLTLDALFDLAYDKRLSLVSTSGLRYHFSNTLVGVSVSEGKLIYGKEALAKEQFHYLTSVLKWLLDLTTISSNEKSTPLVYIEDLLHDRAITVFVAPDRSPVKRFGTDGTDYFTMMKNAILGLFKLPELKKRKDTPLLIGAHDIELLCDLSPIHDLIIDIRHAGWGWFTQIPTDESLSGVNFDNEQLLNFVENTLQLPGPTIPIFSEFYDSALPRWRDQRKAQTLSFSLDKESTPNPWFVTAKHYSATSKN